MRTNGGQMPQRLAALAAVVTLAATMGVAPVGAQELGEPQPDVEERLELVGTVEVPAGARPDEPVAADGSITVGKINHSDLWVWSEGRRGYMVTGHVDTQQIGTTDQSNRLHGPTDLGLVSVDLDTFDPVARTGCRSTTACGEPWEEGFPYWIDRVLMSPQDQYRALSIDHDRGRLFVAHNNAIGYGLQRGITGGDLLGGAIDPIAANERLCLPNSPAVVADARRPCFAGVYVLDARTLQMTGQKEIPFQAVDLRLGSQGPDGIGVHFGLLDMSYSPHAGEEGKLHVLLEELAHSVAGAPYQMQLPVPRDGRERVHQQYVAQIDVASGRTDWVVRINSCVGVFDRRTRGPFGAVFRSADPARHAVWVACWAAGAQIVSIVRLDLDPGGGEREVVSQQSFVGPGFGREILADPKAERILVKAGGLRQVWWVFDGHEGGFIGRIGIGEARAGTGLPGSVEGMDPSSGRLYSLEHNLGLGLGWVDGWRSQLPQFTRDRAVVDGLLPPAPGDGWFVHSIAVDPPGENRPRRVFIRPGRHTWLADHFLVFVDRVPITTDPAAPETVRSDDVEERDGATTVAFEASGRGYGARTILVSGIDGITGRHGLAVGTTATGIIEYLPPCSGAHRQFTFGMSGSPEQGEQAKIDALGSAVAAAQATFADPTTEGDVDRPYSRCRPARSTDEDGQDLAPEWDALFGGLLRSGPDEPALRPPGSDPDASPMPGAARASCALPDRAEDAVGDPVFTGLTAEVSCGEGLVTAAGQARTIGLGPVDVAGAGSTFRLERRDGGGVIAHAESWARGVTIAGEAGVVHIDLIRAVATAWGNGRAQPGEVAENPNCDQRRTAGTCYRRFFSGAQIVDGGGAAVFSCDPCADPENWQRLAAGIQSALGSGWLVSAPDPDPNLAPGSGDGAQAAVLKKATLRFADATLKGDLLPTLPALELVRVSDSLDIGGSVPGGAGRQVFQFAGVEADVSYTINCLLTVVDGECIGEPAALTISVSDLNGESLDGAMFEVEPQGASESVLEDAVETLRCVTAFDGVGDCEWDPLAPGEYVVRQVAAPPGFEPMPDEQFVTLSAGQHTFLDVFNGPVGVTGMVIDLEDEDGTPLEGGEFAVHAGAEASDGNLLAACTTDAAGICQFGIPAAGVEGLAEELLPVDAPAGLLQVAAGPYVVRQTAAPERYEGIDEDIDFELFDGQIARVALTNWRLAAASDPVPVDPPAPVVPDPIITPQPAVPPPAVRSVPWIPAPDPGPRGPQVAPPPRPGGPSLLTIPGDAARLLLRHPKEAAAFAGVLLLFAAAGAGLWRRRMVLQLLPSG